MDGGWEHFGSGLGAGSKINKERSNPEITQSIKQLRTSGRGGGLKREEYSSKNCRDTKTHF